MKAGMSSREVSAWCLKQGCKISYVTLLDHYHGRVTKSTAGAPEKWPSNMVNHLVNYIDALRTALKMPVFTFQVQAYANYMMKGTPTAEKFVDGEVSLPWVRRFCSKHMAGLGKVVPLEFNRDKWTSSANIKHYYDMCKDTMLEYGLYVVNPEHDDDPSQPEINVHQITCTPATCNYRVSHIQKVEKCA
jgi:hypothetical protein